MGKLIDVEHGISRNSYVYECGMCGKPVEYRNNHGEYYSIAACRDCKKIKDKIRSDNYKYKQRKSIREEIISELCEPHNLETILAKSTTEELKNFLQSIV